MRRAVFILASLVLVILSARAATVNPSRAEVVLHLHRLYEACRVHQLETGRFPTSFRDLTSVLSDEVRRQMPTRTQFHDPESADSRLVRRSPIGERAPCLRLELEDGRWLNVAINGWVYESDLYWESEFVHLLPRPFQNPRLLAEDTRSIPERAAKRSSKCGSNQIDLVPKCNAVPSLPWFFGPAWDDASGNKVAGGEEGPSVFRDWDVDGIREHDGILFDVRGVIQLDGKLQPKSRGVRWIRSYPREVANIVVNRPARRLHLLAGTIGRAQVGEVVAELHLRFANGEKIELRLLYGEHVAAADDKAFTSARLHPTSPIAGAPLATPDQVAYSLHHVCLTNPQPNSIIRSLDFISGITLAHPYLLALTVEP